MIQELIDRYLKLENKNKLPYEKIGNTLNLPLSTDFKKINDVARFDYLDTFEWLNSDQTGDYSIVGETLFLREEFNLEENTIAIADEGESVLLMKCLGDHEEIYWIEKIDVERFCRGEKLEAGFRIFPTFPDFFKFLLDQEEKMRAEGE